MKDMPTVVKMVMAPNRSGLIRARTIGAQQVQCLRQHFGDVSPSLAAGNAAITVPYRVVHATTTTITITINITVTITITITITITFIVTIHDA